MDAAAPTDDKTPRADMGALGSRRQRVGRDCGGSCSVRGWRRGLDDAPMSAAVRSAAPCK